MKPTDSSPAMRPPPLEAMAVRKDELEEERAELFPKWKAALDENDGNVTHAAENFDPPLSRDRGNWLTRRLGLVEYARGLRIAATGRAMGRPSGS